MAMSKKASTPAAPAPAPAATPVATVQKAVAAPAAAQPAAQPGEGADPQPFNGINSNDLDRLLTSVLWGDQPDETSAGDNASEPPADEPSAIAEDEPAAEPEPDDQDAPKPDEGDEPAEEPAEEPEEEPAEETGPKGLLRRIDKLTAKRREAEERVAELTERISQLEAERETGTPENAAAGPYSDVWSENQLEKQLDQALLIEEWCEDNAEGGELNGRELTAEEVKRLHKSVRRARLVEGPRRQRFLRQYAEVDPAAASIYPWWKDKTSPVYHTAQQMLRDFPALKTRPDYKIVVGDYLLGMATRLHAAKAKQPSKPTPKPAPKQPAKPAALPPRANPAASELESKKGRFMKRMDVASLAELLE